jgi:hypothetical protein
MKFLLALVFSTSFLYTTAQNCTSHLLMHKGAQLEYKLSMPKQNALGDMTSEYYTVSRLVYEVNRVQEVTGSTFSTIIKKGYSASDEKNSFEREITLKCDGRNLLIPYDFYSVDTIFTRDVYPKAKGDKHGYAFAYAPMEDAISYVVPLVLDGISKLPDGEKQLQQKVKERYWHEKYGLQKRDYESKITIKTINCMGKETVKTEAGSFTCYKFYVDSDGEINHYHMQLKYWLYFDSEAGLIKYDGPGGIIELTSIKK